MYEIGKRIELSLTLVGKFQYMTSFGYRQIENTVYKMQDADGNILVWKTSSGNLGIESVNQRGDYVWDNVHKGDSFTCKATVKENGEYKGEPQTSLTRVKVLSISHVPTKQELDERKAQEQLDSLQGEDFIWRMPYKQYKEHYSDCETVAGSFDNGEQFHTRTSTIQVIIRQGRLVPSGTRGKFYSGYEFTNSRGGKIVYRAVSEENALRRCEKEFPGESWKCTKIYDYRAM